jgi:transcriptional regulator with XRE-family HTH domain
MDAPKKSTLREIRIRKGLTQNELAYLCNMSPGTICLAETGKPISKNTAKFIAHALGVAVEDIEGLVVSDRRRRSI